MTSIATNVDSVLNAIAPILDVLDPAIGGTLTVIAGILSGVAAAEPTAVALYQQVTSGTPPTPAQLQAYETAGAAADAQLRADIIATGGPAD